jgi:charged multivesicular body protein 1
MQRVSMNIADVVRGMDVAMNSMDLEKVCAWHEVIWLLLTVLQISAVMDKFEKQFEDLDVAAGYYENATSSATAVGTPQEDVDRLMSQVADEAGVELNQNLEDAAPAKVKVGPTEEEENGLGERLRALRSWWPHMGYDVTVLSVLAFIIWA